MPSIAAYTPYETLKFCQSIARHGADTSAFEEIAVTLNENQLIRDDETYDATKFTSDALHSLYNELVSRERAGSQPQVNGDGNAEPSNPRKRKASASPEPNGDQVSPEELLIHTLVEKLYAKFREQVIKEIRQDETDIENIEEEIKQLEQQQDTSRPEPASSGPSHNRQGSRTDVASLLSNPDDVPAEAHEQQKEKADRDGSSRPTAAGSLQSQPDPSLQQPPVLPSQHSPSLAQPALNSSRPAADPQYVPQQSQTLQQHSSPGAFHRQLPPPSPQRPGFGPAQHHHGFMPGPQGQPVPVLPPPPGMQHMPPPIEYPGQKRQSTSTPGRGSPLPQQHPHHQYPHYPPYQQPPQWPHPYPHQHGYPQHMPYPNQPYYVQPPRQGSPYQTPHHSPYQPYPQTAPMPYPVPAPQGWHQSPMTPGFPHSRSDGTTPVVQAQRRQAVLRSSGSSTPWKRRVLQPGQQRPASPTRPDREVSPLTDTEGDQATGSPRSKTPVTKSQTDEDATTKQDPRPKRGRPPSKTPSAVPQSRSQSVVSHKSETPTERLGTIKRAQNIKLETPTTPAPASSSDIDQSQRTSGRRGRPRAGTSISKLESTRPTTAKRKRDSIGDASSPPAQPSPARKSSQRQIYQHDSTLVLASKNFAKTSQLMMNEITSHKLANLFAKPLSEREAPGYKGLVLRPQDLKSIRAAISKGSRAAVTAIEALEEELGEESQGNDKKNAQGEGSVGSGMYLIKKTEDIIPPKGIVNSSQLEMELTRIFANAIMFNPLPSNERGFGHGLRIRRNGGDVVPADDVEAESISDEEGSSDDGGIIADAREMFNDVVGQIKKWREVEVERVEGARRGSMSGRRESVSSAVHEEETTGGTPTVAEGAEAERGSLRKRRRLAD